MRGFFYLSLFLFGRGRIRCYCGWGCLLFFNVNGTISFTPCLNYFINSFTKRTIESKKRNKSGNHKCNLTKMIHDNFFQNLWPSLITPICSLSIITCGTKVIYMENNVFEYLSTVRGNTDSTNTNRNEWAVVIEMEFPSFFCCCLPKSTNSNGINGSHVFSPSTISNKISDVETTCFIIRDVEQLTESRVSINYFTLF